MPKTVGDYKLLKTLGEGAFSKVKQVMDNRTGKMYAMKIIDMDNIRANKMENQLMREIDVMKVMNHPNLIKLHAVLKTPNDIPKYYFLVLDLAEGGELFNKLAQNGPLPEDTARNYFQQLIDALDYMHSHNAIHRDLKPENLLLDNEGTLKIADFGLSIMSQGPDELLKTRCGTPNYVAPEIFCADGYVGPSADIWSAGVILYVMLAAALPFDAPTLPELANQIMNVQIYYPSNFPPGAVDLLKKIIVADPTQRYTIQQIKQHPWFNVNYKPHVSQGDKQSFSDSEVTVKRENATKTEAPKEEATINAFELIAKMSAVNMERLVDNTIPVNSSTSFSCSKSIKDIGSIIVKTLQGLNGEIHSKEDTVFKFTVSVNNTLISARIDITTIATGTYLVECCRLKGRQFEFLRLYRTIKNKLT